MRVDFGNFSKALAPAGRDEIDGDDFLAKKCPLGCLGAVLLIVAGLVAALMLGLQA